MPALLNITWRPPNCATAKSTSACTSSAFETSVSRNATASPSSLATSFPRSAFTSAMTTRAPSAANSSTVARPIPLAPPVTMATFPARSSPTFPPRCPRWPAHQFTKPGPWHRKWRSRSARTKVIRNTQACTTKPGSAVSDLVETVDFFRDPDLAQDPYDYWEVLRAHGPVVHEPFHDVWMVTGYEEAVAIYHDQATWSSC